MISLSQKTITPFALTQGEVMGGEFERLFRQQLEPLYGDQSEALAKIVAGEDRSTYLLGDIDLPLGVLVIKDAVTTEEYPNNFTVSGLEIKTLTLFNPEENSGRGLGRILIDAALGHTREKAPNNPTFVTVSSDKPESLAFFGKHNFEIMHSILGAYGRDSNTEHVLVKNPT